MIKIGATEIGGLSGGLYKFSEQTGEWALTALFGNQLASKASLRDTRVVIGCALTFAVMLAIVLAVFPYSASRFSSAAGGLVFGLLLGALVGSILLYFIKRIEREEGSKTHEGARITEQESGHGS
jgi:hypothetical protein